MKNPKPYIWLLASMYLAGIIGLSIPESKTFFQFLTPFHLFTSFCILVLAQKQKNRAFWYFLSFAILIGFFIEVLGVKTQKIFGAYSYQTTLGSKILEVPPMIGINWFLMVFCTGIVLDFFLKKSNSSFQKSAIGAVILTLFDFIAEPVAIDQSMWIWEGNIPPVQNYIAWFIISFIMLMVFFKLKFQKINPLGAPLFIFQILFFSVLRFLIYLQG